MIIFQFLQMIHHELHGHWHVDLQERLDRLILKKIVLKSNFKIEI